VRFSDSVPSWHLPVAENDSANGTMVNTRHEIFAPHDHQQRVSNIHNWSSHHLKTTLNISKLNGQAINSL
jgi:hypothetical protein